MQRSIEGEGRSGAPVFSCLAQEIVREIRPSALVSAKGALDARAILEGEARVRSETLDGLQDPRSGHGIGALQNPLELGEGDIGKEDRFLCFGRPIKGGACRLELTLVVFDEQTDDGVGVEGDQRWTFAVARSRTA